MTRPSIELLPEPQSVFVDPLEATRYLLPILTIDAGVVHPDLSGPLHFVVPVDPYDGVVGEFTGEFHSYTCRDNWLGFRYVEGKYELDTDYQFFEQRYYENHPVSEAVHPNVRDGWTSAVDDHYRATLDEFAAMQSAISSNELSSKDLGIDVRLGGQPVDQNWSNMANFPLEKVIDSDSAPGKHPYPLTEEGSRFEYIGSIEATQANMRNLVRCETLLFFDRQSARALLTYDWS